MLKTDPKIHVLLSFCKIWGVGPSKAAELYDKGFKSIDELRQQGQEYLNAQQRIGLLRYEDLLEKMSREEAAEIEAMYVIVDLFW